MTKCFPPSIRLSEVAYFSSADCDLKFETVVKNPRAQPIPAPARPEHCDLPSIARESGSSRRMAR